MKMAKPDYLCPVCKSGAYIKENPEAKGQWRVKCHWCELKTDWFDDKEKAVEAWKETERYWNGRTGKKNSPNG